MKRTLVLMLAIAMPALAHAQPSTGRLQIGLRSAVMLGKMNLSEIDPAFDDLSTDGVKGAHHSGVFILWEIGPHLRVGFETLVGNSSDDERTTMNFQSAGPVADLSYGNKYFVAGGLHLGAMIVNAMQRDGDTSQTRAHDGTSYKSDAFFAAPTAAVGMKWKRHELRLFVKHVQVFSVDDAEDKADPFSTTYGRIGVGYTA